MNGLLYPVLLFCTALPAWAGQEKHNRLTPQEIADGWILLFDGESTFGWKIEGEAKVEDGTLILGGTKATTAETTTSLPWSNYHVHMETNWQGPTPSPSLLLMGKMFGLGDEAKGKFRVQAVSQGGSAAALGGTAFSPQKFDVPAGRTLRLRNVKYRWMNTKPIFNGKDMTGWKEFPGQKSKFSVTPEGWLNVKNGKGDLQSEGKWADFILQLECISNGDFLNSGIFFRCQADKYQQGYEAQIHNKFNKDADKAYVIEEYDQKTHMLIGKRKEKYLAVDYGTGAIYRRIPARKQMAKDREWFGMTVIAEGRHLAVWVNGVQVTDWTDNRPASDNARNGYRAEAGPISIQGHDPTTDLSFRNIRIAELPKSN
jgi:hypothetical protein